MSTRERQKNLVLVYAWACIHVLNESAQVDWMIMDRRSTAVAAAVCTQLYACTAGTAVRRGVRLTSCVCVHAMYTRASY
jgi:hypothetical protein